MPPVAQEATVDEAVTLLGEDYDIILPEGFKRGTAPKIELHRKGGGSLIEGLKKLIAIVTGELVEPRKRQFSPEDIGALADLLEKGFIKPQKGRISLYASNMPITLTLFSSQIISNVVLAMTSCPNGVGEIQNLKIFVKKE